MRTQYYNAEEALEGLDDIFTQMDEAERSLTAKNGGYRTVENNQAHQRIASDRSIYDALNILGKFFEYSDKFTTLEKWGGAAAIHRIFLFFDDLRNNEGEADGQEVGEALDLIREAVKRDPDMTLAGGREEWEENWYRNSSVTGIFSG